MIVEHYFLHHIGQEGCNDSLPQNLLPFPSSPLTCTHSLIHFFLHYYYSLVLILLSILLTHPSSLLHHSLLSYLSIMCQPSHTLFPLNFTHVFTPSCSFPLPYGLPFNPYLQRPLPTYFLFRPTYSLSDTRNNRGKWKGGRKNFGGRS